MTRWETIALGLGAYALGGVVTLVVLVNQGIATGATFDGFTGKESEGLKAVEAVGLWPLAAMMMITNKK